MPKMRSRSPHGKRIAPVTLLKPETASTELPSPPSTSKSSSMRSWAVYGIIAVAICGGLSYASHVAEKDYEARQALERAKPKDPATSLCTQVTVTEVKNPDGSLKATERAEAQVPCVRPAPVDYKPFEFPLWVKVLGWVFFAIYILLCILGRSAPAITWVP